ncbi:MAG: DUF2202 domain-containing protein [Sulfurimonadaceae bacterium]
MNFILKVLLPFMTTLALFTGCQSDSSSDPSTIITEGTGVDLDGYTPDALSDDQKYALAYMWHEEKLAHDLYLALNEVNATPQLSNIATNSETTHIQLVEELVEWYDLNITNLGDYTINYSKDELEAMPRGVFTISAIQDLYDALYAQGSTSKQASLEVGCIVEVVDVDDLNEFIEEADDNQALIDTFTILREGSYSHYWTFDNGLKKLGISEGCCSLAPLYCKTVDEYPQK